MTTHPPSPNGDRPAEATDPGTTRTAASTATGPAATLDTSYEVVLDDPPPGPPAPVDPPEPAERRRPLIPPAPAPAQLTANLRHAAGRWAYVAAFHTVRAPWYALTAAFWSVVGAARLADRQLRWWWVNEQHGLRQQAATSNDPAMWLKLHREVKATRRWRGLVLLAELGAATVLLGLLGSGALPRWLLTLAGCALLGWLAHLGRPADRPIIAPALVAPRFRKLTSDVVLRAYYAAGLGHPERPGQQIMFGSPMSRDGDGSRVLVDLPYGKGLNDAINAREKIASGLDVSLSQVFITRDPTSHRRHVLWVADRDPLALPAGRTPLLGCKPTDIWTPAPFGLDERGQPVTVPMLWNSILVGAQPRQGKTFSARLLALYAALDPYTQLSVFDGKGSPDWRRFALVAEHCAFGLAMTRDGDPLEAFLTALRALKADVQDRYARLSELPAEICPEGKLTRELARDPAFRMPVRLVVIDEFQEYFDTPDPEANREIAALLVFLVKVAPAAGVIVLGATQKPSGIGTGQVAQQFNAFRDNFQIRFALRTGSWQVSDLVLGAGAYAEGYDSSLLLPDYKGVGILRGAADRTPTVRTHLADAHDTKTILTTARALRERAGTLTGYAAGERITRELRDVLTDTRGAFEVGESWASWQQLAARLAERIPEHYADLTPDALSAQLRALGVPSVNGKQDGRVLKGAKTAAIEVAIARRQTTNP